MATRLSTAVLARIEHEELEQLLRGYGWTPYFVEGHEPELMHQAMAATLDIAVKQIKTFQQDAVFLGLFAKSSIDAVPTLPL